MTDLSSTMKYRRDSFLGFLHYYLSFAVFGIITLSWYFIKKKRWPFLRKAIIGELSWYAVVGGLFYLNAEVTLFVFIIPWILTRFLLMAGNWTQHAFVDTTDPANPYLNSITFIDSPYNKRCFNDGYHIGHHVNMNRHWLDMPIDFMDNLENLSRNALHRFPQTRLFYHLDAADGKAVQISQPFFCRSVREKDDAR